MKGPVFIIAICTLFLSACSTLGQSVKTQYIVARFDEGAHTVSNSEMAFLQQVQTADCTRDFYNQAFRFATTKHHKLDLMPKCTPRELTNHEMAVRRHLMNAITLYADSLVALTNGANDSGLNRSSATLATNIESFASQQKFGAPSTNGVAALNAAVVSVAEFVIDHHEDRNIAAATAKLQKPLETIVNTLKAENKTDAQGIAAEIGEVKNDFRIAVLSSREKNGASSFLDIAAAHAELKSILITPRDVTKLNNALDALVEANHALAKPDRGTATLAISALVNRGRQAVALFHSSK